MEINLPPKVRFLLYIVTGMLTPVVAVLTDQNLLPGWVFTIWMAEVTFVSGLAAFNVAK